MKKKVSLAFRKKYRKYKIKKTRIKALDRSPQKRGDCEKVFKASPKKPNSANRSVAKVVLSNDRKVVVFIPGQGHNLQKHSTVLVRGGGAADLPGVNYKVIRGKFDLEPVTGRKYSRSKYGAKRHQGI